MKRAYIFPGQGSQFCGMGKNLYESNARAAEMMETANSILEFRITDVMFSGTDEELRATRVTQPAIFIHSSVLALCDGSLGRPDMTGGHSLGEFSALVASGAVDFEDALKIVAVRAEQMQKCCEAVPGKMAAIIGLPDETVIEICGRMPGIVIPANFNCPGQIVISGEKDAVDAACAALREAGARRALPLNVSGAFHSPLMAPAAEELAKVIGKTPVREPFCPVFQNVTALPETDPARIKANLLAQLTSPVRWTGSVLGMMESGATDFVEIGPGAVLQGLVRRIAASVGRDPGISGLA